MSILERKYAHVVVRLKERKSGRIAGYGSGRIGKSENCFANDQSGVRAVRAAIDPDNVFGRQPLDASSSIKAEARTKAPWSPSANESFGRNAEPAAPPIDMGRQAMLEDSHPRGPHQAPAFAEGILRSTFTTSSKSHRENVMYNFTADRVDLDRGSGVTAVVHDDGAGITIAFGNGDTVQIPGLTLGVAGGLSGVVAISDCLRCTFRREGR